jgi:hypothetical protein
VDKPIVTFKGVLGELWAEDGNPDQLVIKGTSSTRWVKKFNDLAQRLNESIRGGRHYTDAEGTPKPLSEMDLADAVEEIQKVVLYETRGRVRAEVTP